MLSKIHYISRGNSVEEQKMHIRNALDAGCKMVQLRFKNASKAEILEVALAAKAWCSDAHACLIINDSIEIAREADADGVHLGLTDDSIAEARSILGPDKLIGGTANTLEDVLQRIEERCDYVGLGPFRFTTTKANLSPILGLEGYTRILSELTNRHLSIPVYAIGGILKEDVPALIQTGVYGIALSGMITDAADRAALIYELEQIVNHAEISR